LKRKLASRVESGPRPAVHARPIGRSGPPSRSMKREATRRSCASGSSMNESWGRRRARIGRRALTEATWHRRGGGGGATQRHSQVAVVIRWSAAASDGSYNMEGGVGGVRHRLLWRRNARGWCSLSNVRAVTRGPNPSEENDSDSRQRGEIASR
jgi:hypothetical protein